MGELGILGWFSILGERVLSSWWVSLAHRQHLQVLSPQQASGSPGQSLVHWPWRGSQSCWWAWEDLVRFLFGGVTLEGLSCCCERYPRPTGSAAWSGARAGGLAASRRGRFRSERASELARAESGRHLPARPCSCGPVYLSSAGARGCDRYLAPPPRVPAAW